MYIPTYRYALTETLTAVSSVQLYNVRYTKCEYRSSYRTVYKLGRNKVEWPVEKIRLEGWWIVTGGGCQRQGW